MQRIAAIDFETTGLSAAMGDRATEIAIVMMHNDKVVDRFESLMNAGVRIQPYIEELTGISNKMIARAPRAEKVMAEARRFVGSALMVAHNASFDQRFWMAELGRLGLDGGNHFACTMLLSRRLYPSAENHKLGTIADFLSLPRNGRSHRAMPDAELAASLFEKIQRDLRERFHVPEPDYPFLTKLQKCQAHNIHRVIERHLQSLEGIKGDNLNVSRSTS